MDNPNNNPRGGGGHNNNMQHHHHNNNMTGEGGFHPNMMPQQHPNNNNNMMPPHHPNAAMMGGGMHPHGHHPYPMHPAHMQQHQQQQQQHQATLPPMGMMNPHGHPHGMSMGMPMNMNMNMGMGSPMGGGGMPPLGVDNNNSNSIRTSARAIPTRNTRASKQQQKQQQRDNNDQTQDSAKPSANDSNNNDEEDANKQAAIAAAVAELGVEERGSVESPAAAKTNTSKKDDQDDNDKKSLEDATTPPATKPKASAASSSRTRNRTWDENYAELLTFKATHGHCMVPYRFPEDRILGKWVSHLREYYNQGNLSDQRIDALKAIGFCFNPQEKRWNDNFERLKKYKEKYGHTKVPVWWKEDKTLGKWVSRQREEHTDGILPEHRRKQLDGIGFVWKLRKYKKDRNERHNDAKWEKHYQKLVDFHKEYGHANVPNSWPPDPLWAKWVCGQRTLYARGLVPKERIAKFDKLGFVWLYQNQKKQKLWNKMYELLKTCVKEDGSGFMPQKAGSEAASLSRWMMRQREAYKYYRLDPGREILLNKIGFKFPDRPPKEEILKNIPGRQKELNLEMEAAVKEEGKMEGKSENGDDDKDGNGNDSNTKDSNTKDDKDDDKKQAAATTPRRSPRGKANNSDDNTKTPTKEETNDDKVGGDKVAESIGVLAKALSMTPDTLAARLSGTPDNRSTTSEKESDKASANPPAEEWNAFSKLMPMIVRLRDTLNKDELHDCGDFVERMIQRASPDKVCPPTNNRDGDPYNRLLSLAVDLGSALDASDRGKVVVQSCESYFQHMMETARKRKEAPADDGDKAEPEVKKRRTRSSG